MQVINSFVSLECKFVNNFKINTDNRYIIGLSFHILQI